jgi:RNA polymerase-binding transcription factor DksA
MTTTPAAPPADSDVAAAAMRARLVALDAEIAAIEGERRAPLAADFAEQAAELEGQDAMGGIEDGKIAEAAGIRAALARIDAGTYGVCAACGCDIPAGRLAAVPTATTCVNCRC